MTLRCTFCRRSYEEVDFLIYGEQTRALICGPCVDVAAKEIAEQRARKAEKSLIEKAVERQT